MNARTAAAPTPSKIDRLCRQLVAGLGWKVLALPDAEGPIAFGVGEDETWPLLVVPELLPLTPHFDRILVQYDRVSLVAFCIRDRTRQGSKPVDVPRDLLVKVGHALRRYCNKVYGVHMAAGVEVWEIGEAGCEVDHLHELRPSGRGRGQIHLAAWSLGLEDEQVWTSLPLGGALTLRDHLQRQLFALSADEAPETPAAPHAILEEGSAPWATWGLAAFIALIFSAQIARGGLGFSIQTLYELGALHGPSVLAGDWPRMLTAIFLHGNVLHLALNLAPLVVAGATLESMLGRAHFVALFLICGLAGTTASLIWNDPRLISVGASGGVIGLLVCALVVGKRLPPGAVRAQISLQLTLWSAPALLSMLLPGGGAGVDIAAHVGGATAGGLLGYALLRTWPRQNVSPPFPRAARLAAGVGMLGILAAFARVWIA